MGTPQDGMEEAPHVANQVVVVGVALQENHEGEGFLGVMGLQGATSWVTQMVDHVKDEVVTQSVHHPLLLLNWDPEKAFFH